MCGLAGFWGTGERLDVERMIRTVHHRGPDDGGVFSAGDFHVAHARLSVIDLTSAGHQPMLDATSTIAVVFNGEIYNFEHHRARLQKTGYQFRGTSDTEVILALYSEMGERCFAELDGMFAFALWDKEKRSLFLVRDRMGKKPLYYAVFENTLVFGSELKTVLAHPLAKKELSAAAVAQYLAHEYIPTPLTPFANIYKVRPGTYICYRGETLSEESFWDTSFLSREPLDVTLPDAVRTLDERIHSATLERLVADVPVGMFLSGGLDSSTIAYHAAAVLREQGSQPLQTFSIGFQEAGFDESEYAERVAQHIGANHHVRLCTADDVLGFLPELAKKMDEPFADASLLPTSLLAEFTQGKVTVALGGDGGDELFLGYDTFLAHQLAEFCGRVPASVHKFLYSMANMLPTSHRYMSFDFKLKRFLHSAKLPLLERNQAWLGAFTPDAISEVLSAEMAGGIRGIDVLQQSRKYASEVSGDLLRKLSWVYARTYMMDGVMVKADRASMFHSLEVRSPLLATSVVEYAYALPSDFKLKNGTVKYVLKKTMEGRLPQDIIKRKKKGFGPPVGMWLRGPLLPLVKEKLSRERIGKQGIFTPSAVDALVQEHEAGTKDRRKELWTLLMFQLWYDNWYD